MSEQVSQSANSLETVDLPRIMEQQSLPEREVLSFGPFHLHPQARLLTKAGHPVELGARAFDVLSVLVRHAGEVVTKRSLFAAVWKDVAVEEGSLRFHVSELRRALGDGGTSARYVETLTGQGYCFVAQVTRASESLTNVAECEKAQAPSGTPSPLARMIGRTAAVENVADRLLTDRFVTLIGPGGIGKTTVGVAVIHKLASQFGGSVAFIDLCSLNDPSLVPSTISAALGLAVQSTNPAADLITFLRDKSMLLVLDSCDPVLEAAATLAERLYQGAPKMHLLATSREAMRVEGEHVIHLLPLESPPDREGISTEDLLSFPASQLFAERLIASGRELPLRDIDAAAIGQICRKLDGIPLAIELAAGRVNAFGIQGTAEMLNERLDILTHGRRTALPRHQTLAATLDWSHELLSNTERLAFRRLSVFAGAFTLDGACSVLGECGEGGTEVTLASLVGKSLVAADLGQPITGYRLLDTTRAYARRKLERSGEWDTVARRHAEFVGQILLRLGSGIETVPGAVSAPTGLLADVRAALKWTFSTSGDVELGVTLAAVAAPFYIGLSLLTECRRWCDQALESLDHDSLGGRHEMELQADLGLCLMFTESNGDEARTALERAFTLAEELRDPPHQLRTCGRLHLFHYRTGNFRTALALARRGYDIAQGIGDAHSLAVAHSLLGISYHLVEDLKTAHGHLEAAIAASSGSGRISTVQLGVDYQSRTRVSMARTLWLLGFPDQASAFARRSVDQAIDLDHPISLCLALTWAVTVSLWNRDWEEAEMYIDRLVAHARSRSILPYNAVGSGLQGYLAIKRGNLKTGVDLIQSSLQSLQRHRYELLTTILQGALAEGLAGLGERDRAIKAVDNALSFVKRTGEVFNVPELFRIRGEIFCSAVRPDVAEAEACFVRSLDLASQQSALSWELRTAISLARLKWSRVGAEDAYGRLHALCGRFTEGFERPDFREARVVLDKVRGSLSGKPSGLRPELIAP